MKLSKRDRYLIKEAFEAGYSSGYIKSREVSSDWLNSNSDRPSATIEDELIQAAAEIKEDETELSGLVRLSDIIPILEEYSELDGDKYKATQKPGHGSCCTCQDCGHDNDECVCDHNEILHLLKLTPKIKED